MHRILFDVPYEIIKSFESRILITKIKKDFTILQLFNELIKVIKSKPIILIEKLGGICGTNWEEEGPHREDIIKIDPRLRLAELPGVLIHELFHTLFPQLHENEVLSLEFMFVKKAKKWQINKIVNLSVQYCKLDFRFYIKRVHVKNILKRK